MINEKYKKVFLSQEANRCLLCHEASCTKACPKGLKPDAFIRSIKFNDETNLDDFINKDLCANCDAPCEASCIHFDFPIRIKDMVEAADIKHIDINDVDLSVSYLGIKCENPFFLSSSIVAGGYEMCTKALHEGWAGIVYKTITVFDTPEASPRFDAVKKSIGSSFVGFRNMEQASEHTLEEDIETLSRLKRENPTKVIGVSIMGRNEAEWTYLAKRLTEANVDFIECNFSCPHSASGTGAVVGQCPDVVKSFVEAVKKGTNLPVVAKMTPNISDMVPSAYAALKGGADGLAAINTIKCISGINLNKKYDEVSPHQVNGKSTPSGYSGKAAKPIALRFMYDLKTNDLTKEAPLSGMGGVETWQDAAEFLALGCDTVQVTTAIMEYGYRIVKDMITGFKAFLKENNYKSVSEFIGSSLKDFVALEQLERNTIVLPKYDMDKCIGCGRCYISCFDAGHQALTFDSETRKIKFNAKKCVGCHLCSLVCPANAITKVLKRFDKKVTPKPKYI